MSLTTTKDADEINVSYLDVPVQGSLTSYASWHLLRDYLEAAIQLSHREELIGLTVTEQGIQFHIRTK